MMRLLDFTAALLSLIFLSPLFAIVAIMIKHDSPGPVFHNAQRVGRNGELFRLYKFRSMVADAERIGPSITTCADPRVTTIGRRLRRTKIDELPQLINVLKGDMSTVGPRPEDPCYVTLYTAEQRQVLKVRPGITSPASLRYLNEEQMLPEDNWEDLYIHQIMPAKLNIELSYLENRTIRTDLAILLGTVRTVLVNRGQGKVASA